MRDRFGVVLRVARDPTLLRIELAYLGFNMAEFATWIAILVYGYRLGGAGAAAGSMLLSSGWPLARAVAINRVPRWARPAPAAGAASPASPVAIAPASRIVPPKKRLTS